MTDTAPSDDITPLDLAQALDAGIDAVDNALDTGDTDTAAALIDGLAATADSLLDALGAPEPEDIPAPTVDVPPAPSSDAARSIADIPAI